MDKRENFERMMQGDHPEWIPMDMWTTPPILDVIEQNTGTRSPREAFDLDLSGQINAAATTDPGQWREAFEAMGFQTPEHCEFTGLGQAFIKPPRESMGGAYHLVEKAYPCAMVETLDQLKSLPWPNPRDPAHYAEVPAKVREAKDAGRVVSAAKHCTIFEVAWYIRSMDQLFMDIVEENGIADWLFDYLTEHSIAAVEAFAKADADVIQLGDDVGTQRGMMMSIDMWRTHLKPRLKKVIDAIRTAEVDHTWIFYHSDGDIREILDDLIEIGVEIVNPMQPECMPLDEVMDQYRDRLRFWGMIGTQTTMPFGTPDDVRAAVAQCEAQARKGSRLVISPTHMLEPDVPWANVEALVDAVKGVKL